MAKRSRDEIDHYVLDQFEQEKHLGIGHERTKNLGHDWPESEIEKNPAGRVMNYDSADTARTFRNPSKLQGIYQKTADPRSGIASANNLKAWSGYSTANSYDGKDPKGRGEGSDGHLASTKGWAGYTAGADTGEGRLEKIHRK
jgi:hypothetical protein